jgi:hypothetical protein
MSASDGHAERREGNYRLKNHRKFSYIGSPELAEIVRRELERHRKFEEVLGQLQEARE